MQFSSKGFTLIELLITIAIVSILSAFAVSSYQGHLQETYLSVAKINAQNLRLFLDDYYMHNASYIIDGHNHYTKTELNTYFGWQPDGDNNQYNYTVIPSTQSWDILVEHTSGHWLRCERRMQTCCDQDTLNATKTTCTPTNTK